MRLVLAGGNTAQRLLRNRGKLRNTFSFWNERILRRTLGHFLAGQWQPERPVGQSTHAISLTSWSKRLDVLPLTLLSLVRQDVRPEAIYVSLTGEDLGAMSPSAVEAFSKHGVVFTETPNYLSHKKWLPLLLSGRERPFVVCDDDIIYPRSWFGKLVAEDRDDAYVGVKCHRILLGEGGAPLPYSTWVKQIYSEHAPSHYFFTTGCGGEILHPSRVLPDYRDWDRIAALCPKSDDVWLKAAHLAAGIPVFKTKYCFPCLEVPGTDITGLSLVNNTGLKDKQIAAMEREFRMLV
jgi:hypothetical protein